MLQWFRIRAPHVAALAIAVLVGSGGLSVIPHQDDDCHESLCAFVQHDASAHRIAAQREPSAAHPDHCLVCHWTRSFRLRTETRVLTHHVSEVRELRHVDPLTVAVSAPVAQPPLRSPPPASPVLS
jgi:hypothetical protein